MSQPNPRVPCRPLNDRPPRLDQTYTPNAHPADQSMISGSDSDDIIDWGKRGQQSGGGGGRRVRRTLLLCILDDPESSSVLYGPSWVLELGFPQDVAARLVGEVFEPDLASERT
jgi:hypothetical protein